MGMARGFVPCYFIIETDFMIFFCLFPQNKKGTDHRNRHFKEVRLATCSTRHFLSTYRKSSPQTLWVIHASRTDLILALKSAAQEAEYQNRHDSNYTYQGGLLLTGSPNISFPRGLQEDIFDMVTLTVNFPTM
jgi:hypothetical protein